MTIPTINVATFPVDLCTGARDACCFFAGAFLGRNDAAYLHTAGITDVACVDTDEAKLIEMHEIYPPTWKWLARDAYEVARETQDSRRKADVVTVDPWTGDIGRALWALPLWLAVTERVLIIGTCLDWFDSMKLPATLDGANEWITRQHWSGAPTPPPATRLVKYSEYRGGLWWLVFELA